MNLDILSGFMNRLYYGDNLTVLRGCVDDESVDLIYLDPPFNSQATYNVLFRSTAGEKSARKLKLLRTHGPGAIKRRWLLMA
jgi:site-specific DNA-methyltransferase (adenine-specific)